MLSPLTLARSISANRVVYRASRSSRRQLEQTINGEIEREWKHQNKQGLAPRVMIAYNKGVVATIGGRQTVFLSRLEVVGYMMTKAALLIAQAFDAANPPDSLGAKIIVRSFARVFGTTLTVAMLSIEKLACPEGPLATRWARALFELQRELGSPIGTSEEACEDLVQKLSATP